MASSMPLSCKASHAPAPVPALIEDDSGVSLLGIADSFVDSPCSAHPVGGVLLAMQPSNNAIDQPLHKAALDLSTISSQLSSLAKAISHLSPSPTVVEPLSPIPADAPTSVPITKPLIKPPCLLSTLSHETIISLLHHEGTNLPSIHPCNTANVLDKKTHWTSEELHRAMGCRKFWNYKHILQVSCDGKWMDGGEFPPSLGSYATIRKANSGYPLERQKYKYLDAVHMDIAFGDCLSVGGFQYALILVNRDTQYNWAFGLRNLSLDPILSAIWIFWAAAGSLARCFYCKCDHKLFGTAISKYLIDN
jgi:hypothetical protein